jgi:hypothetical protein
MERMEDTPWHPWQLGLVRPSLDALPHEDREAVLGAIEALKVDPYNPPGHQVRPLRTLKHPRRWLLTLPGGVCIQYEPVPGGLPPVLMKKTIKFWSISILRSADPAPRADGRNEEAKLRAQGGYRSYATARSDHLINTIPVRKLPNLSKISDLLAHKNAVMAKFRSSCSTLMLQFADCVCHWVALRPCPRWGGQRGNPRIMAGNLSAMACSWCIILISFFYLKTIPRS